MKAKSITSQGVQTKVANAIEKELGIKLNIYDRNELQVRRSKSGSYAVLEIFEEGVPFLTAAITETIQEVVKPWSDKYENVWYDLNCKPEARFDKDHNLEWSYIPSIQIHVGQNELWHTEK